MTLRVLLADDHQLIRAGIRALLKDIEGVEVVAEAADGAEAVRLALELQPTIVLLDISMPRLDGLSALRQIREAGIATRVLLLSMHDSDEIVSLALRSGAAGYLVKDAAIEELALALKAVARGDCYLSPSISRKLVQALGGNARSLAVLTTRQTEILCLVANGRSSKEIARDLGLSVKTVETHRAQIMERLQIHDLAGLVRYAIRSGLVGAAD